MRYDPSSTYPAALYVCDPLWPVSHTFPMTHKYDRHLLRSDDPLSPSFLRSEAQQACQQHEVFPNIESDLPAVYVEYREFDRKMRLTYSIDTNGREERFV